MALAKQSAPMWQLETDGASRGNPGPAATAYVLTDPDGEVRAQQGEAIGKATNNVAEYRAVLAGLYAALQQGARAVKVCSDSQLLVRQLEGVYKVRSQDLRPLYEEIITLSRRFDVVRFQHVPREENRRADALANEALDKAAPAAVVPGTAGARRAAAGVSSVAPASGGAPAPAGSRREDAPKTEGDGSGPALLRVRYGETDQMGFAYYANYLDWFTVGRTNYLRRHDVAYAQWEAQGIYLPVRRAEIDYRWPALYDQVIAIHARIVKLTPVRITFEYEIQFHADAPGGDSALQPGDPIAVGKTEHGVIAADGTVLRLDRRDPRLWSRLQAVFKAQA